MRMRLIATDNIHVPEVKVYINGSFVGYASLVGKETIGGSEAVWDMVNEVELRKIERRLRKMALLFN